MWTCRSAGTSVEKAGFDGFVGLAMVPKKCKSLTEPDFLEAVSSCFITWIYCMNLYDVTYESKLSYCWAGSFTISPSNWPLRARHAFSTNGKSYWRVQIRLLWRFRCLLIVVWYLNKSVVSVRGSGDCSNFYEIVYIYIYYIYIYKSLTCSQQRIAYFGLVWTWFIPFSCQLHPMLA